MNDWKVLAQISDGETISRGAVFRFPAGFPYEEVVDFFLFQPLVENRSMGFVVMSGHKSGLISVVLPLEAQGGSGDSVDAGWLKKHWQEWVWPDCTPEQVLVRRDGPSLPETA